MDEFQAYAWAGIVLRGTEKMGLEPHHGQVLADRIASALVEATRPPRKAPEQPRTLADALAVVKPLDPGPEWCSPVSSIAVPVWALRLMVGALILVHGEPRKGDK
jgi:hypothetical protein